MLPITPMIVKLDIIMLQIMLFVVIVIILSRILDGGDECLQMEWRWKKNIRYDNQPPQQILLG